MSGGTTTQSGTSTQINQIPQWMSDAGQQNYAFAQQVAEQPLQQYQGQMVADVSPQTQQSWNVAANSGNVGADQYNAATAGYLGALSQTPMQVSAGGPTMQVNSPGNANAVTAGNIANTNLQPYMNPYTNQVINSTIPLMQQQNALSQNQQANAANSANAFGGSRQGIQQGVAQSQGALNIGNMVANLQNQNFQQAQAAATGDINRQLQAATTNQASQQTDLNRQNTDLLANQSANAADLQRQLSAQGMNQTAEQNKINSDILASQGLTNTGQSMNAANAANYNMLASAGASQSMQAQNQINAQMAKFAQAFNYPQQQLGTLLSALGMTPHDTSTSGQTTQQTTTPTDWASIITKGMSAASDLLPIGSDKKLKTDITPLGKDPQTGVPISAFRYKGDPKSYPKVVGPMAQDVQEADPDAVAKVGSKDKGALAIKPRGYAAGTPFVQPPLAPFVPPSSPGVAKGIGALSAFRPPVRLPRGAMTPAMPRRFAFGTSNVPNMDDVAFGDAMEGGNTFAGDDSGGGSGPNWKGALKKLGGDSGSTPAAPPPKMPQQSGGWNAPSMGYAFQGYKFGTPNVGPNNGPYPGTLGALAGPTASDTVPAMLTPGEAVLTKPAAEAFGRQKIAKLNAMMPPTRGGQATSMPRAGARGIAGALANTKLRPKVAGGLSG